MHAERRPCLGELARWLKELAAALVTAVAAYSETLDELRDLVRGIEADWQAKRDRRSSSQVSGCRSLVFFFRFDNSRHANAGLI
jgi:hypothetical protein